MEFLRILYRNYYYYEKKVGDGDIASGMAILFIVMAAYMYTFNIMVYIYLIWDIKLPWIAPSIAVAAVALYFSYFSILKNKRYRRILVDKKYATKKNKVITFLFTSGWVILTLSYIVIVKIKVAEMEHLKNI